MIKIDTAPISSLFRIFIYKQLNIHSKSIYLRSGEFTKNLCLLIKSLNHDKQQRCVRYASHNVHNVKIILERLEDKRINIQMSLVNVANISPTEKATSTFVIRATVGELIFIIILVFKGSPQLRFYMLKVTHARWKEDTSSYCSIYIYCDCVYVYNVEEMDMWNGDSLVCVSATFVRIIHLLNKY